MIKKIFKILALCCLMGSFLVACQSSTMTNEVAKTENSNEITVEPVIFESGVEVQKGAIRENPHNYQTYFF